MARKLPDQPLRLHRFARSGHCHRVELLLSMLELPVQLIDVNLAQGEQKTSRFLQLNPFGQVPVLEDGARVIADSNAILVYLATEYGDERWLPRSSLLAAEQQRWFSVAAGPLASGPALARVHHLFGAPIDLAATTHRAQSLLRVMNLHLATTPFLVGSTLTLADVANYSYVAHAPEGGISLEAYPHVLAWLRRVEAAPHFVAMPSSPLPL